MPVDLVSPCELHEGLPESGIGEDGAPAHAERPFNDRPLKGKHRIARAVGGESDPLRCRVLRAYEVVVVHRLSGWLVVSLLSKYYYTYSQHKYKYYFPCNRTYRELYLTHERSISRHITTGCRIRRDYQ